MKRLITICLVAGMILAVSGTTRATWHTFQFSEEDLWKHTPSADQALYNQEAPRRHHTVWKGNVQTTDSNQPNLSEYQRQLGKGTNGFPQTAMYDSWLNLPSGPEDSSGNSFGITQVQLWGANFANSKFAWGERFKIADTGTAAWNVLQTPAGWTGSLVENPWPDPGFTNDMYFVNWDADSYANRILYSKFGDGKEDYIFKFSVDIVGEYPSALEDPPDGNPFESDGRLRIWFGGYVVDMSQTPEKYLYQDGNWYTWDELPGLPEGYDGIMMIPEPATIALLGLGGLSLLRRRK